MKKLLKPFVLAILILFTNCKQKLKKQEELVKTIVTTKQNVTKKSNQETIKSENKTQTIDGFLKGLQEDVKNNNILGFEKKVKIPFEYKSGGESMFYEQPSELIKSSYFKNITKAKFEKEEDNIYSILYEEPKRKDFFIYYYVKKDKNKFKLIGLEMPH